MKTETKIPKQRKTRVAHSDGMVIAANFKRLRLEAGYKTQQEIADAWGVTVGYIGQIESGAVSFGTRAQEKWASRLSVSRDEFTRPSDSGIPVKTIVTEKGLLHPPDAATQGDIEPVPLPPGYTRKRVEKERVYALKVVTDTLYPYLRKDACLYAAPMPLAQIGSEDLVIYRDGGGSASLKEVERLPDGRFLLKGLGRGATLTLEADELPEIDTVFLVARPKT
jgi:transcriptional regulator with XRE-family HTH domain